MGIHRLSILVGTILAAASAYAGPVHLPAARMHVRIVDGRPLLFTSKLTHVVDLNFTFGNAHPQGKQIIASALDRIARTHVVDGVAAFTVKHIASPEGGAAVGMVPEFGVADLSGAEVLVANNISYFGDAGLGKEKQDAIRNAIESEGKGYLAFHASGDNKRTGWKWLDETLHPTRYQRMGARITAPVYKHLEEARHVVLEDILETGVKVAETVPDEIDAEGKEVLARNVSVRWMKNEWYQFGRDITRDSLYRDKVTPLLKYDPRVLANEALPFDYHRKGGGILSYLYRVGNGTTSYLLPGHENDELLDPSTGFDGGTGDFDRYVGQLLFFLAGYRSEPCDIRCNGLAVVDSRDRIVTNDYQTSMVLPQPGGPAFVALEDGPFEAWLTDVNGRVVARKRGAGEGLVRFDAGGLRPGIYFLNVKTGGGAPWTRRYAVTGP